MRSAIPAVVSVFDVEPRFIGGTETYARELSAQLARHGWRSVLCFATPPSEKVRRFLELPNISLESIGYLHGVKPRVISRLVQLLRRHRPRIAHFHYTDLLSPYPWLARLLSTEQVFFTDHSSRPENHLRGRASLPKRCLARAISWPISKVVCVSDYGYRCFTERGLVPASRCEMIYNGVDLGRVVESAERANTFRRRFSIPGDRHLVLQVSWIIPEKGILDFLTAARSVVSQSPRTHFVLVGEGPYREEYTRKSVELGLSEHLTWTGLLDDPFTAGAYDAADVVCQVSRWEEVFGWVIAEAMAYRKPVIATRVGGIPELVTDHESGILIDRGDPATLAATLLSLLADSSRRQSMGAAGRRAVDAKFDLMKNVARLLAAYGIREGQPS